MTLEIDRLLGARLVAGRGRVTSPMVTASRRHRVHTLLAASLTAGECDPADAEWLLRELRLAAALDAWDAQEIGSLLAALAAAGIPALLFKGAALAHTVYPQPHLRPRVDTDLFVPRAALEKADGVFGACGWTRAPEVDAELISAQRHYSKPAPANGQAHVDVHWKVANPRTFADVLSFDEASSRAIGVPSLGPSARAVGAIDALLLACVHRVAHHQDSDDLIWLWDIHLLVERLLDGDREAFAALATRTAMRAVCRRGIARAAEFFETPRAADVLHLIAPADGSDEPSARFLGGIAPVTVLREDLAALDGWRARARLLSEHLFPPVAYMRTRYPRWPPLLLPLAYATRIARGAPKWLRRS